MTESATAPVHAVVNGIDIDAVAAAVRACPGVADLTGGRLGDVASYLPGRRVSGVLVETSLLTVQVRSHWGVPADALLSQIELALLLLRHGRPLHVVVADIDDPPDERAPVLPSPALAPTLTEPMLAPSGAIVDPLFPRDVVSRDVST